VEMAGRSRECSELRSLIAAACSGSPQVRVLRGPPGVGKTTLLSWAASQAANMRLARVVCDEISERVSFAALGVIAAALSADFAGLSAEHRQALDGMLGARTAVGDPAGVGAALLGLFSSVAESMPLIVLIDDAHWIDAASNLALNFVLQRMEQESVLLLFAERDTEPRRLSAQLPRMEIEGLSPLDAAHLLGADVSGSVAEALAAATDGNPFAMLEIASQLTEEQRRDVAGLPTTLPVGEQLLSGFLRRVADLRESQSTMLLCTAVDPRVRLDELYRAAEAAGYGRDAVDSLIAEEIVLGETTISFAHPLLRHAVMNAASDKELRIAHNILAEVLSVQDIERRAWHRAESTAGPEPDVARELEQAAQYCSARGDFAAAGRAFERAADFADDGGQVALLTQAGNAFLAGSEPARALRTFDRALGMIDDPIARADIHIQRFPVAFIQSASELGDLELLARSLAPLDSGRAATMATVASQLAVSTGRVRDGRRLAEFAAEVFAPSDDELGAMVVAAVSEARALGGTVHSTAPILVSFAAQMRAAPQLLALSVRATNLSMMLGWLGEFSEASRLYDALVRGARSASAISLLSYVLIGRSDLYYRTGLWNEALRDGIEAYELANASGSLRMLDFAAVIRGRVEASVGRFDDAEQHLAEAAAGLPNRVLGCMRDAALGFTEISRRNFAAAVPHLEGARAFVEQEGGILMMSIPWASDLLACYVRLGRLADASQLVNQLTEWETEDQGDLPAAILARCRGLTDGRKRDAHFLEALELHARVHAPFETARTHLCFGELLRRESRNKDAVAQLEAAAELFASLGATPWLEQTHDELAAAGVRQHRSSSALLNKLTPRELQVALAVADGATSHEAATQLFLSRRTVEYHLQHVYQKLGVRSRAELVRLISRSAP